MLYSLYEAQRRLLSPIQTMAGLGAQALRDAPGIASWTLPAAAALDLITLNTLTHRRPDWRISPPAGEEGQPRQVVEEVVEDTPFCTLRRFDIEGAGSRPRVLLVAPISGHFATLLRPTVSQLLADHEVFVTDWKNARDVPLREGRFGFDDQVELLIRFMRRVGPGGHLFAVCQPSPAAVAATALMSEDADAATPLTLTLMAGPIDTAAAPTAVTEFADTHPLQWFEQVMVHRAPMSSPGAGRRVYPGAAQIAAFMSMNIERHIGSQLDWAYDLRLGQFDKTDHVRSFYDEYYAVSDLPAEFFLETVDRVFQRRLLAKGELEVRGRRVDPGQIRKTALLTVEGGLDDICAPGQTSAAHALFTGIPAKMKASHVQAGAGHYGVFGGSKWRNGIYPVLKQFIARWNKAEA
jgi:polyhydroxyalkanoate depolymerase